LEEILVGPKIRLPKTSDCRWQVDEAVAGGKINQAERSMNRYLAPLSLTAASPIIDQERVRAHSSAGVIAARSPAPRVAGNPARGPDGARG